jgi:hypothetical protein
MNRLYRVLLFSRSKSWLSRPRKTRRVARAVAPQHIVERLQRFDIKLLGFVMIADWNGYVFNHAPNIKVGGAISIAKFLHAHSMGPAVHDQGRCRHPDIQVVRDEFEAQVEGQVRTRNKALRVL